MFRLLMTILFVPSVAWAQGQSVRPAPSVPEKVSVVSLHRAHQTWNVRTSIRLTADVEDLEGPVKFEITAGPQHHGGSLTCDNACMVPSPHVTLVPNNASAASRGCECTFQPEVGSTADDSFFYRAHANGQISRTGVVEIDVRESGVRWEVTTNGTTGLSSDLAGTNAPSVIGKSDQDITFRLNWQLKGPSRASTSLTADSLLGAFRAGIDNGWTQSFNLDTKVGLVTAPVAVRPFDKGATGQDAASQAAAATEGEMVTSNERLLTFGSELNWNAVKNFDGVGTFFEAGVLGRANFDAAMSQVTSAIQEGRVFELRREDRGTFRGEIGLRFAIKNHDDAPQSLAFRTKNVGGTSNEQEVVHETSSEDLFVIELGWQLNNALAGLSGDKDVDSRKRYLFRATALPEVPGLPGHPRVLLGIEVSRALNDDDGPKIVRFFYGVNVSR